MPSSFESTRRALALTGHFPRTARIRKSWEFRRIHRDGVRVRTRCFTVIARKTLADGRARLGCAISRKVGSAVIRNRLRRLLRETFRRARADLAAVDMVVIVHPEAAERHARAGLESIAGELLPAFEEASARGQSVRRRGRRRTPRREKRA